MKAGIVIPVGPGREENLGRALVSIEEMKFPPEHIVLVCDGPESEVSDPGISLPHSLVVTPHKHEPGREQPRNVGVRVLQDLGGFTHAWFLDTDIILDPWAHSHFHSAMEVDTLERILVGPYDWLAANTKVPVPDLRNDPRWPSFDNHDMREALTNDLSAGLACFSGNLIWPIEAFVRIGGFWNELHHGRCEDGELGLRAVACGVPISFVAAARGWHLDHPINGELTLQRNERDVPMLNDRHPWVQGEGLFVVEEDGKRFNTHCRCGWSGNTMEIWEHQANCDQAR